MAHFADRDENVHDVWEAVADPEFPVRRGRFDLSNGDLIELNQDEANGDSQPDLRMAKVDTDRMYQRPYNGGDLLTGGLMMGGPRGVRSRTGVNIPSNSPSEEHEVESDGEERDKSAEKPKVEFAPGLTVEATEEGAHRSGESAAKVYGSIDDEVTKTEVGEIIKDGVVNTYNDATPGVTNVDVDLPAEEADKLIERIADKHGLKIQEPGSDKKMIVAPDGTRLISYDRDVGHRGVEVTIEIEPGSLPNAPDKTQGKIKISFTQPRKESRE